MRLQESGEMYLETILILSRKSSFVRSIDVAEHMGFSKPSVSRAVHVLQDANYVSVDENGGLSLTEAGYAIAEKIYERHELLSHYLQMLGVSEKTAVDDACKMEHYVSEETFEAIKRHVREYDTSQR